MIKVNRESFWTRNSFEILEINTQNCDRLFDTSRNFEIRVFFYSIIFDSVAAQEYVLLCCQSNLTGGFTDRPKANNRYSELAFYFFQGLYFVILVVVIFIIHAIV
jgi:prenyltransferase beta subunit